MREMLEHLPDPACIFLIDGKITSANSAFCVLYETNIDYLQGNNFPIVTNWAAKVKKKISGKNQLNFTEQVITSSGDIKNIDWLIVPKHDKELEFLAIGRDITIHKNYEDDLASELDLYKTMVDSSTHGIFVINSRGVITAANRAFVEISGYRKEDVIGIHFTKIPMMRIEDSEKYSNLFKNILEDKVKNPLEILWKHKNGELYSSKVCVNVVKRALRISGISCIVIYTEKLSNSEELAQK